MHPMSHGSSSSSDSSGNIELRFGHEELVIGKRYEALSIANDVLIAIFFVLGSAFLFDESLATASDWCFLIGSIEFLIRPAIRLSRRFHLQRIGRADTGHPQDY